MSTVRIAALDMGSNSFHLLVVEAHPDGTFESIMRDKEMLRLGDVVAREGAFPPEVADRAVECVRRFKALADAAGADEVVAKATSAIREADNGDALVDRIAAETGVEVEVISGRDEARLIFGAIRASVVLDPAPAVCFDLGGGSLEVMAGDAAALHWATSVHLGVARLTAELVRDDPPSAADLRRIRKRVTSVLAPIADETSAMRPRLAVGSSGTLCDLARMVAARREGAVPTTINQFSFGRDELSALHQELVALPASERAKLPGLEPRRADQIPVGSAFLMAAFDVFGFDRFTVSEWALREGIVLDAIPHHDPAEWDDDPRAIRRASVLGLARRCGWDEDHSRHVERLALQLFDGTARLHGLSAVDRELLAHAALLHDIGEHVSAEAHHKHTAYLVEHGRLRGFSPEEVLAVAAVARYHRRSDPMPAHEPFARLSPGLQERVTKLAALLRLADGLDRGHLQAVEGVGVDVRGGAVRLLVSSRGDCDLELWGVRRKRSLFERLFDRRVEAVPGWSEDEVGSLPA